MTNEKCQMSKLKIQKADDGVKTTSTKLTDTDYGHETRTGESMSKFKVDGFVKSPTAIRQAHGPEQSRRAALRFIFRHCGVLVSTPHSSRFASLAFGAFYFAVPFLTFYEFINFRMGEKIFLSGEEGLFQRFRMHWPPFVQWNKSLSPGARFVSRVREFQISLDLNPSTDIIRDVLRSCLRKRNPIIHEWGDRRFRKKTGGVP